MRQTKRKQLSRRSVRRPRLRNTIRWILYVLFIFLAFVTANGGDFIKPLLLIPVALCIASVSGTVVSGGIGILCGLLLDISCGTLPGYHGILLFLICLFTSRLYDRFLLQRFWNMMFLTAAVSFVVTGLDFVFQYAIWGYDNVFRLYLHHQLPCLGYTVLSSVVIYPIFALIHHFLLPKRRRTIEKKHKPMEESA